MQKIVFCAYRRQKWISFRQTKTKMIIGPSYTYCRMHFTSEKMLRIICNYPGGSHVAAISFQPTIRAALFYFSFVSEYLNVKCCAKMQNTVWCFNYPEKWRRN